MRSVCSKDWKLVVEKFNVQIKNGCDVLCDLEMLFLGYNQWKVLKNSVRQAYCRKNNP